MKSARLPSFRNSNLEDISAYSETLRIEYTQGGGNIPRRINVPICSSCGALVEPRKFLVINSAVRKVSHVTPQYFARKGTSAIDFSYGSFLSKKQGTLWRRFHIQKVPYTEGSLYEKFLIQKFPYTKSSLYKRFPIRRVPYTKGSLYEKVFIQYAILLFRGFLIRRILGYSS